MSKNQKKNKDARGGPVGNNYGTKLKEPDIRQEAYKQYCEWIAKGESKEAWTFQHGDLKCTHRTMEKYIRDHNLEFPTIHKEFAEAQSLQHWLSLGKQMMTGQIEKCQPAIYQMMMRNKFGWDKESIDEVAECAADKILERLTQK